MIAPDEFSLIEQYVDGTLADDDFARLESVLADSSEARALLRSLATLDFGLHELSAGANTEIQNANPLSSIAGDLESSFDQPPIGHQNGRRKRAAAWTVIASIAACLLLAVGVSILRSGNNGVVATGDGGKDPVAKSAGEEEIVATLAQASDAKWNKDSLLPGDAIRAQVVSLESGIVRLQFVDGVEVTLQGPAEYEIIGVGHTRLHSGLLTANVPPGAEGFRVETPAADIVDLGTAFGVQLDENGDANVSVFDGEVELVSRKDSNKRLLTEGETVQLAADGTAREVDFSSKPFEKLWPAASGIAGSTGAFQFAPQWPRRLKQVESNTKIFVVPEGYARELDQNCVVDMTEDTSNQSAIPVGQRVRSFLLQFNPVDSSDRRPSRNRPSGRRIKGSITFQRPVVGLIINTETLKTTDGLFSPNRTRGLFGRGLELAPPRMADVVSLSEDRRTLTLDLFVVNRLSDHVRVIVDAEIKNNNP